MSELQASKESNRAPSVETLFDTLNSLKREAFSILDQALSIDAGVKNSTYDTAIIMYQKGVTLLDKAIDFYKANSVKLGSMNEAVEVYNKLTGMKNQTKKRLDELAKLSMNKEFLEMSDDVLLIQDDDLINIENSSANKIVKNFEKANEICKFENSVQLFYIGTDGNVSTPHAPQTLTVYTFDDKEKNKIAGFIKVGGWMYPLIAGESPGMKTNFNAYIFPNDDNDGENASVENKCHFIGITFNPDVRNREQIAFFEDILTNYGCLVHQEKEALKKPFESNVKPSEKPVEGKEKELAEVNEDAEVKPPASTAENIAGKIMSGAQYLSKGLTASSEYASKYLQHGSEKLKTQLEPNQEPVKVDPKVKSVIGGIRYGSHQTVRVSSYLVNKLGSIASSAARTVAPHIRDGSAAILHKTGFVSNKTNASNYVDGICTVTHSSLQGFSMVYDSIENAAKTLGKSFTEQTVTVLAHKYGDEVAKVTENSMYSVGNVAQTAMNFKDLKITRTLAKATAKEAIKYKPSSNNETETSENKSTDIQRKKSN